MQTKDCVKESMQTFFQQTKGSRWTNKLNETKQAPSEATLSVKEQRALAILQSSTMKKRGHYKTPLLWKCEPVLPNNRTMAGSRLHSTKRKLIT